MLLQSFRPASRLVTQHTLVERPRFPVVDGLDLADQVLHEIYSANARRILSSMETQ